MWARIVFTYSIREEDKRRVITDGALFPVRAMIAEKSRSCVRSALPSASARAMMA
jgi:hypothetical protein